MYEIKRVQNGETIKSFITNSREMAIFCYRQWRIVTDFRADTTIEVWKETKQGWKNYTKYWKREVHL